MSTEKTQKNTNKYLCELCYFTTSYKSDYTRHLATAKHKNQQKSTQNTEFKCSCGKQYKERSGLWRHKQKCNINNDTHATTPNIKTDVVIETPQPTNLITPELVVELIKDHKELLKDNKEMKQIIIDLVKNGTNNTINNNTINNTFNLNLFLNETCKDAINMRDFINSIQLTFEDFLAIGELGYVGAISKVVISKLNELGVTQRPIHCSDKKRDTLHIKDNDKWEKNCDKIKIRKVIGNVSHKYVKLIPDYQKSHPDCQTADSKLSDKYNKSVIAVMDSEDDNKDKVINNISKVVTVEKKQYATATAMID